MSEEITETAKAVQEVAKTTGQAIGTVEKLGIFFSKIMGESIDATCGMLADTLKYKRWERQTELVEKAERLIKDKNLEKRSVPISAKLALPIFQNASVEDDDFLHDLYAKLLVSAIDPEIQTRRTAFVEILRQLEPIDVQILQAMHAVYIEKERHYKKNYEGEKWYRPNRPPTFTSLYKSALLQNLSVNESDYWESVDNLCRLGLADSYFDQDSINFEAGDNYLSQNVVKSHGGYDELCITALGVAFIKVCNY